MRTAAAFSVGEYSSVIPLLLSKKRSGHVHSIFSNGFNITMEDSLVFIGNKKSGRLPFGIHLLAEMTEVVSLVSNQEPVRWNEETSTLEFTNMSISLRKGQGFENSVAPLEDFQTGFDELLSRLIVIGEPTGLDIYIDDFIERFVSSGEKKQPESEQFLFRLINAAASSDRYEIEKTLRYFLGRGRGLTPSGDDLLVGFLAFDSSAHFVSPVFYQHLSDLIERELITTDVGREYVRYALKHEFSSTVTDVVNHLSSAAGLDDAFERLLGVGHSSGLDTLFGILTGMLAFNNSRKKFSARSIKFVYSHGEEM